MSDPVCGMQLYQQRTDEDTTRKNLHTQGAPLMRQRTKEILGLGKGVVAIIVSFRRAGDYLKKEGPELSPTPQRADREMKQHSDG